MNILINWFTTSFAYLSIIRTVNHVIDCDFILTLLNIFILIFPTPVCSRPSMFRPSWEIKLGELFYFWRQFFFVKKEKFLRGQMHRKPNKTNLMHLFLFVPPEKLMSKREHSNSTHLYPLRKLLGVVSGKNKKKHKK